MNALLDFWGINVSTQLFKSNSASSCANSKKANSRLQYEWDFLIINPTMNPTSIKVIFFDLDNTLFDHTCAERTALLALIDANPDIFELIDAESFVNVYQEVNRLLWKKMAAGDLTSIELKRQRFEISLNRFERQLFDPDALSKQYFASYAAQSCANANAHDIVAYLQPKYPLGILSNGFPEIQERKLQNMGMAANFKFKIYSGEVGAMKPSPEIFEAAMTRCGANADEIVFVGDSLDDDVKGAKAMGWKTIHFNPSAGQSDGADVEIRDLLDLREIL
jgi:putative hydrolase of the HAD superfamily